MRSRSPGLVDDATAAKNRPGWIEIAGSAQIFSNTKPTARPNGTPLANGDLWYKVSERRWWVYFSASSVWRSQQLHIVNFSVNALTIASPLESLYLGSPDIVYATEHGLYLDFIYTATWVGGENSGCSASHYWNITFNKATQLNSPSTVATVSTAANSVGVWSSAKTSVAATYKRTANDQAITYFLTGFVGSPGNFYASASAIMRLEHL